MAIIIIIDQNKIFYNVFVLIEIHKIDIDNKVNKNEIIIFNNFYLYNSEEIKDILLKSFHTL